MITAEPTEDSKRRFKDVWDGIVGLLNLGNQELEKIADAGRQGIALNFATESAGGDKWPPLAPMTQEERISLGFAPSHPILQRTGDLKLSLIDPNHPLNATEVFTHGGHSYLDRVTIELGSLDDRFPILHAGGETDLGYYIPPRPMTVLGDEAIHRLETSIIFVIEERWKRLGH
jgi:hypothetical protein